MAIRTARDGKQTGVWEVQDLQAAVDSGEVISTDLVWTKGLQEWLSLSDASADIGIALPCIDEEMVPPIPGSKSVAAAPANLVTDFPSTVSKSFESSLGDLTFRRRSKARRYGFSAGTKVLLLALMLVGGWSLITYGIPFVSKRWAANFERSGAASAESGLSGNDSSSGSVDPRCLGKIAVGAVGFKDTDGTYRYPGTIDESVSEKLVRRGQFSIESAKFVESSPSQDYNICEAIISVDGMVDGNSFRGRKEIKYYKEN